jgi:hypothetical protein
MVQAGLSNLHVPMGRSLPILAQLGLVRRLPVASLGVGIGSICRLSVDFLR